MLVTCDERDSHVQGYTPIMIIKTGKILAKKCVRQPPTFGERNVQDSQAGSHLSKPPVAPPPKKSRTNPEKDKELGCQTIFFWGGGGGGEPPLL